MHDRKLSKDARISEYSPEQTYLSVGLALSYWEASEDVLMGLFNWLCQEEHVAMKAYLRSPRTVRSKFIKDALDRYNRRISDDEKSTILKSMKELDKLAQRRNQIAHGHVSDVSRSVENEEVMKGVFLMPALSESGLPALREPRYSLTSGEIDEFREEVRDHRWAIHTAHAAAMVREQNSY